MKELGIIDRTKSESVIEGRIGRCVINTEIEYFVGNDIDGGEMVKEGGSVEVREEVGIFDSEGRETIEGFKDLNIEREDVGIVVKRTEELNRGIEEWR